MSVGSIFSIAKDVAADWQLSPPRGTADSFAVLRNDNQKGKE